LLGFGFQIKNLANYYLEKGDQNAQKDRSTKIAVRPGHEFGFVSFPTGREVEKDGRYH
jgi:hypothetical protein